MKVIGVVADDGVPVKPCDRITSFVVKVLVLTFTSATVVFVGMSGDPETPIPTLIPLVSGKDKTMRGSVAVAG